ncbi:hypothetical protein AAT19DRAFT_12412 [Rhodotorula toruloides]|uniref:Uncharacterized protein n=1 Tax=Rhodotorula toruloides TaxID=5286 RepID=A0A2T0AG82_RHOTO|nr:hypothetical protein AAT19DRAFT_12412 [Rhodotorula toruloides]
MKDEWIFSMRKRMARKPAKGSCEKKTSSTPTVATFGKRLKIANAPSACRRVSFDARASLMSCCACSSASFSSWLRVRVEAVRVRWWMSGTRPATAGTRTSQRCRERTEEGRTRGQDLRRKAAPVTDGPIRRSQRRDDVSEIAVTDEEAALRRERRNAVEGDDGRFVGSCREVSVSTLRDSQRAEEVRSPTAMGSWE